MKSLVELLRPPNSPVETLKDQDWAAIERRIGHLPEDYRAFLQTFGTGCINDFVWIFNPLAGNTFLNLFTQGDAILNALRELRNAGESIPFGLYPEGGGLLPFGKTDNGDTLFWLTEGDPIRWPIVVNASRDPTFETFKCSLTTFLVEILTQKIHCSVFPQDFPSGAANFHPGASRDLH